MYDSISLHECKTRKMSEMKNDSQPQPLSSPERIACQLANMVGILAGIGAIPLLRDRLGSRFWMAEAAIGALVIVLGLFFLERRAHRLRPFLKRLLSFLRGLPAILRRLPYYIQRLLTVLRGLPTFFRSLPAFIRRAWNWIRRHLPRRRKGPSEQIPIATRAVPETSPAVARSTAPATSSATIPPLRELELLPYQMLLIGLFILLPAALVACTHSFWAKSLEPAALGQIAVYFSTPALLIWVLGEFPYAFAKIVVQPWNGSIITGVLKSGLQVLSAMLVWVFLALSLAGVEYAWPLFGGLGLALAALVLGFASEAIERRSSQNRPQKTQALQRRETVG